MRERKSAERAAREESDNRIVARIEKTDGEEIRATLTTYKGRDFAHLRLYYRADDGEWRPTQKGVAIAVDRFDELEDAVAALRRAIGTTKPEPDTPARARRRERAAAPAA